MLVTLPPLEEELDTLDETVRKVLDRLMEELEVGETVKNESCGGIGALRGN